MDMNVTTRLPATDLTAGEHMPDAMEGADAPLTADSGQSGKLLSETPDKETPVFSHMLESARKAVASGDTEGVTGGKGLPLVTAQPDPILPETQLLPESVDVEIVDPALQPGDEANPLPILTAISRLPEPVTSSSRARPSLNLLQANPQSSMPQTRSEVMTSVQAEEQLQLDKLVRQGIDMLTAKDTDAPLPKSTPVITTGTPADSQLSALLRPATAPTMSENSATPATQLAVNVEVGRSGWDQSVGRQLMWMAKQNIQTAELRLNPANLGPVEVRIDIEDEQVRVAFSSPHAAVRDAVEQAVPRLKEMFDNSGLQLADTEVSHQSFAQQQDASTDKTKSPGLSSGSSAEVAADESNTTAVVNSGAGLLDIYI